LPKIRIYPPRTAVSYLFTYLFTTRQVAGNELPDNVSRSCGSYAPTALRLVCIGRWRSARTWSASRK